MQGGKAMSTGIKVTPLDIQQKRFHVGFRGYDQTEVNMFLDLVRDQMEDLIREVTELREFRQAYDDRRRELIEKEETVKNTMLLTQKLVDDQKENSRKESSLMIKDAEMRIQQMMLNAQQEKMKLEAEILELKRRKHHFMQDVKKVVQMHLEMVQYEEGTDEIKVEPLS
jgi:cell division initiation protein